ncbi:MAG: hypothetical protein R3D59_10370 [Paracoccaceae bacterium]
MPGVDARPATWASIRDQAFDLVLELDMAAGMRMNKPDTPNSAAAAAMARMLAHHPAQRAENRGARSACPAAKSRSSWLIHHRE